METLSSFVRFEIWALLIGLMLVIGYQILTGRIRIRSMLVDKETHGFSPGRVQLLFLTSVGALYYLAKVADNPAGLPEIPQALLAILGGSSSVYLAGKAAPILSSLFSHEAKSDKRTQKL